MMIQMKWRFLGKSKVGLEFEVKRRQRMIFLGGKSPEESKVWAKIFNVKTKKGKAPGSVGSWN